MCPNNESLARADELTHKTIPFRTFKTTIQQTEQQRRIHYLAQKQRLLKYFNASEKDWRDWHWQMKHRIKDVETLSTFISFSPKELDEIKEASAFGRFAIVPYYLALINDAPHDPIQMLSVPSAHEIIDQTGEDDPMGEEFTNPAGSITRRYPDRLIINVTNICAMYCRHCQRRRLIGENDHHTPLPLIDESIDYIRSHTEIRDVLLTGGDCLLLSDSQLEYILQKLRTIKHVEIIRIGTRTPVTMPMRITKELCEMIVNYHPVYLNTHFNHPFEVTEESQNATKMLAMHGIPIGNQAVLLKGINDDPFVMTYLNQRLLQSHVRPYYIFHAKNVRGTHHFHPSIETGLSIMEFMRGNTSGLAIPTYIMNAPKGFGKVPILPSYIIKQEGNKYTIRTWENKTFVYED
jgi:lysine 2,3-aminomutase